jgi:uncharacterized protein YndB with AHSA1/START domain
MVGFTETIEIEAPRERVWEVLADIGSIQRWNPGVKASRATSDASGGEGATRHCDLQRPGGKDVGYLEERAFDWCDGAGYRIEITDSNLPFRRAVVSFDVAETPSGTQVDVSPEYELRFGPAGRLLDRVAVRRQYRRGMAGMLAGLKHYVETGEKIGDRPPAS